MEPHKEPIEDASDIPEEADQRPLGAIVVTTALSLIILFTWFGMYALSLARS